MNKTSHQQAEAMIALHATQGAQQPQGEQPSHEELALLMDGRLSFIRRKEVLSHINADTELFSHWVALVEAKTILNETTEAKQSLLQRLQQWFNPTRLGFIGTALAAITTVAIVLPLLDGPATISPQQPRSTPDYASSGDVQIEAAVQAGIVLTYKNYSDEIKQTLPINLRLKNQPAPEASTFSALNPLAIQFGETLLESYRSCQKNNLTSITSQQNRIKQLLTALDLPAWSELKDSTTFCKHVDKELNNRIK